ncbi:plastocyanin/azurin family copper-binding protein [Vreelandella titanicae]|uniref:cupredoxin domain-containing protein n=1 Tax=Halomonadaceae TaxID=28256 RepID=UPI0004834687|nr:MULTISPECIES: plastocyanin/azurin family copper-binding protein [unclassified Halomonas]NAO97645.1 copper-binding protein [Halomonas sp. MG34]PKH62777.1 copper-binding protein [Halomonas sp. Choline-3u-9]QGQ69200.1 copper-binding protein [Halomonas sp. PA16-9]
MMRKTYLTYSLLTISLCVMGSTSWAAGEHDGSLNDASSADVDRTISFEAGDMWFDPEDIQVTAGETIKFEISNTGNLEHEFVIGDKAAQEEHRKMMQEMSGGHGEGHGGHDMAEGAHGGQMPSITIGGGETKTLVWTASSDVDSLEYACNIPGHYESGMYGDINF